MDEKQEVPEPQAIRHLRDGILTSSLWIFFLLFVVYPLSIGPAAWLHLKVPSVRPVIEGIYLPITALIQHSELFDGLVHSYVADVWQLPSMR